MGKRIGRPTKRPKANQRVSLGLKVTAKIKRKLDAEARKTGRSQSQEAELRIENSFKREKLESIRTHIKELDFSLESVSESIVELHQKINGIKSTLSKIEHNSWVSAEMAGDHFRQKSTDTLAPAPAAASAPEPH